MIELFFATSVNVYKIAVALEEMELPYEIRLVDISKGEQLDPANLAGSPTQKVPVIRDDAPIDGGVPQVIFESGAILEYLAQKSGRFLPAAARARTEAMQWLFWQIGGLGPIGGQAWHFHAFAPRIAPGFDNSYSRNRYFGMMSALWRVLDTRLADRAYLAHEYSIADMACFPWVAYFEPREGIGEYRHIERWRDDISARPAVRRAYERAATLKTGYELNEKGMSLFPWDGVLKNVIVV